MQEKCRVSRVTGPLQADGRRQTYRDEAPRDMFDEISEDSVEEETAD